MSGRDGNLGGDAGHVTNGILGHEKTRKLPTAFMTMTPILRESTLTREYCNLSKIYEDEKLNGLYVIPSALSCDVWFGVLFVHGGSSPYQGGIFRFTVQFPLDFPTTQTVPAVTFQPPVFHPCIHPTRGIFDLRRYFKHGWNQQHHRVWQILKIIKTSFYKIESTSLVNKQANDLLENNLSEFNLRVQKDVESSTKRIYDDAPPEFSRDLHWMKFSPYDSSKHDVFRQPPNIKSTSEQPKSGIQKGLSWL